MHYLVVSDIHSNAPALEAVLRDALPFDAVLCLGDIVGYGPDPNECVMRLRNFDLICISGNHDQGAIGKADLAVFNYDARQALLWTRRQLSEPSIRFLRDLSSKVQLTDRILLSHGSPRDPTWEYLVSVTAAAQNFQAYDFDIALVGHSHLPLIFEWRVKERRVQMIRPEIGTQVHLAGRRLILNPGSVGQPRDGDPRASYALWDTDEMIWTFRRVAYPVQITQERMRAQGLPERLVERLELGR